MTKRQAKKSKPRQHKKATKQAVKKAIKQPVDKPVEAQSKPVISDDELSDALLADEGVLADLKALRKLCIFKHKKTVAVQAVIACDITVEPFDRLDPAGAIGASGTVAVDLKCPKGHDLAAFVGEEDVEYVEKNDWDNLPTILPEIKAQVAEIKKLESKILAKAKKIAAKVGWEGDDSNLVDVVNSL